MGRPFTPIRRMRFATYFPLVACVILLHLRLVSLCQATVSECLTCATFSGQNDAFADACRNGDAAKIPKVGCKASSNYGCGVSVKKTWVGDQLTTTWTRSCCSEQACQDDVHTNEEGQEFDADSIAEKCSQASVQRPIQSLDSRPPTPSFQKLVAPLPLSSTLHTD